MNPCSCGNFSEVVLPANLKDRGCLLYVELSLRVVMKVTIFVEKEEIYLIFKALNTSNTGTLSLQEFYNIYYLSGLSWKASIQEVI